MNDEKAQWSKEKRMNPLNKLMNEWTNESMHEWMDE